MACLCLGLSRRVDIETTAAPAAATDAITAVAITAVPDAAKKRVGGQKRTALHLAAESGHVGVLQALFENLLCSSLAAGGEYHHHCIDSDGDSVRSSSGSRSRTDFMRSVINAQDSRQQTPLLVATARGHTDCVSFLLSNGADRSIGDAKGNTPLHVACARGFLASILMLSTEYLDEQQQQRTIDAPNAAGFTPLHHAVWGRQSSAVQILLQQGADMTAKNTRAAGDVVTCPPGTTPLHLAACRGNMEICRILLKSWLDRVVEPMMSQGAGDDAAVTSAAIAAVDPRGTPNAAGHMPYQLAQRLGFFSLALFLRPTIPIIRLFNSHELDIRFYGPPQLKAIAASALNHYLVQSLDVIIQLQTPYLGKTETKPVPAPVRTVASSRHSTNPDGFPVDLPAASARVHLGANYPADTGGILTSRGALSLSPAPSPRENRVRIAASPRQQSHTRMLGGEESSPGLRPVRLDTATLNELNAESESEYMGNLSADVASVLEEYEMPQLPMEMPLPGGVEEPSAEASSMRAEASEFIVRQDSWSPEAALAVPQPPVSLQPDPTLEFMIARQIQEERTSHSRRSPQAAFDAQGEGGPEHLSYGTYPASRLGRPAATPPTGEVPSEAAGTAAAAAVDMGRRSQTAGEISSAAEGDMDEVDAWLSGAAEPSQASASAGRPHTTDAQGASRGMRGTAGQSITASEAASLLDQMADAVLAVGGTCGDPGAGGDYGDSKSDDEQWIVADGSSLGRAMSPKTALAAGIDMFDDDDFDECGVCLECPPRVVISPCSHHICGACAKKMCTITPLKPSSCPFCRSLISKFSARSY